HALEACGEVLAFEELHRDVGDAVAYAVVEDLHDVRAAELGGGLRLALEASADLRERCDLGVDELHRARDVEARVMREPDGPHAALPELADEPESIRYDGAFGEIHALLPGCSGSPRS